MENIPQVFGQLDHLAHVTVEYSSTLFSYKIMTKIFGQLKETIEKEITNRQKEVKFFTTQQGIGLRKLMFQHYQKILKVVSFYQIPQVSYEHDIFSQVTQSIYEKHKAMENSLNFVSLYDLFQIKPIMKEIEHKAEVLEKQLIEVKQNIEKLKETKTNHKDSFVDIKSLIKKQKNQAQSEIFKTEENFLEKNDDINPKNSHSFSLFSPRKFSLFETQAQFSQVESFLQLKLQEVQEFIKLQKQLTQRTIKKIFEIFDQTMGKGLERMQKQILASISINNVPTPIQVPLLSLKNNNESWSQIDLSCYQSLSEIMKQDVDFEKFRFIRKRLYESSEIKKDDLTESNKSNNSNQSSQFGISPTFKFTCPLVIESVQEIKEFMTPNFEATKKKLLRTLEASVDKRFCLYDSFCKENVNTINI